MAVRNAGEASEIVREFMAKFGYSAAFLSPSKAEKADSNWVVEVVVAFKRMRFSIDAETGEITSYETLQ